MQIRTGTVTVTANSPTVTGTDTTWNTGVQPGHMFLVRGDATPYVVASVVSDTQIQLSAPYQGATRSGQFYWITTSFTPYRSYPIPEAGDVDPALVLARAISEIDADMGEGVAGGGSATRLANLSDVDTNGVIVGDVLTYRATGTFGFEAPASTLFTAANIGTGTGLFSAKVGSTLQFKSLLTSGATLTPVGNDLLLTVTPTGEANTASSVGTATSLPVFRRKTGTNLEFYGLRAGSGVSLSLDTTDIVVSATGTGGTTGGEANTGSNLGIGGYQPYKSKSGVSLQFRSIDFAASSFSSVLSADGNTYTVSLAAQPLDGLSDVSVPAPTTGQLLGYANGTWSAVNPPASGIASVSADPAPALGGNLSLAGRRILGVRGGHSGHIEKPKVKAYTLDLASPTQRQIISLTATSRIGTVSFEVLVGGSVINGLSGQSSSSILTLTPLSSTLIALGSMLQLRVTAVSADAADFAFTLAFESA